MIYAGYEGGGSALDNLAPTFILIDFWVGLVFASVLFGDVFRAFSPWRAIQLPGIRPYPERWGRYPAALALLGFTWVELVSGWGDAPADLTTAAVVYTVYTLAMQAVFGTEAWTRNGEAFAVYFNLFSRMSVWETRDRVVGLRPPLGGLPRLDPVPGTVLFVAVMIGTVTFDGFSQGQIWNDISVELADALDGIVGLDTAPKVVATLGLLLGVAVVGGFYRLGIAGARSVGGDIDAAQLRRAFIHTLVPIAMVYVAAHYLTFLLFEGQATLLPRVRPAGARLGPVRDRVAGDRLHVPQPERDLVPAGRVRRRGPRRGADTGARPRARALSRAEAGRPLAVLDARGDDRLHVARPVAAGPGDGVIEGATCSASTARRRRPLPRPPRGTRSRSRRPRSRSGSRP